jgi:hypothetical protein
MRRSVVEMNDMFPDVPDSARLWVFPLARELAPDERALVRRNLDEFLRGWKSHGAAVHGSYEIVENRFVLIAGYTDDGVSGCSTDSMVRVMKSLRDAHGIDGFDRSLVFFRDAKETARAVSRDEFQALVASGSVSRATVVFDPTVQTVGDLRAGRFETTFADSWHSRAFVS